MASDAGVRPRRAIDPARADRGLLTSNLPRRTGAGGGAWSTPATLPPMGDRATAPFTPAFTG